MIQRFAVACSLLLALVPVLGAQSPAGEEPKPASQSEPKPGSDTPGRECPMHQDGAACCRHEASESGHGPGRHGAMQGDGMGRMQRGGSEDHQRIHALMADHKSITRKVEEIPDGVRTVTTSEDAEIARTLVRHTRDMKKRLEAGQPIRMFDPLFQEIFRHREAIEMKIEEIPGGVRVTETSKDPQVVALIRQHAKAVSAFTAEGMARMHEPSPLPEGYRK